MTIKELVEKEIEKGVSRRRLATIVGVSLGTVQNVLLGDTEIKNSTLEKFSRYFNVQGDIIKKGEKDLTIGGESMEYLKKYVKLLEKENERLEGELRFLREGDSIAGKAAQLK